MGPTHNLASPAGAKEEKRDRASLLASDPSPGPEKTGRGPGRKGGLRTTRQTSLSRRWKRKGLNNLTPNIQ